MHTRHLRRRDRETQVENSGKVGMSKLLCRGAYDGEMLFGYAHGRTIVPDDATVAQRRRHATE
jgi:hypothetical protein